MQKNKFSSKLEEKLGYNFINKQLLEEALTHPSCHLVGNKRNNERLEFLGDAILNMIIAKSLFKLYLDVYEDKLSSMRAKLVSCEAICLVAERLFLKNEIILSPGEERNGGRDNQSNIENALEALIGAIYLDSDFDNTKQVVSSLWKDLLENEEILKPDSKTFLQEWTQSRLNVMPKYEVLDRTGPSHAPIFTVRVEVDAFGHADAKGSSKKEAEKLAAADFIKSYIAENGKKSH